MKIFILVLILSLLCKLNCKKSKNHPELQHAEQDADLKDILTDKLKPLLQGKTENKMEADLKDILKDKLKPLLQGQTENKMNADLKDILKEKLKPLLQGQTENKMEADLKDILKDKLKPLLQGQTENKQDAGAGIKDIVVDKLKPLLQGDPEIKNNEKDQTCENCGDKKLYDFNEEEADQELFPGGDVADLFGNNQHYKIPDNYQNFARRFILQYPYTEKKSADEEAEDDLHNTVQQYINNIQDSQDPLPIKAPPEFVIDIAKRSLILDESKPKNPTDDIIHKDILRSGNYWNYVRKEEIDPKKILRSTNSKKKFESVGVQIKPGSKLYNLISMLKEKSPRLLYVINKDFD